MGTENEYEKVSKIYSEFKTGRIEELTETIFKTNRGLVVVLPFKWTHIANWDQIYQLFNLDPSKRMYNDYFEHESKNNLVVGPNGKLISLIGIEDVVIIDTNDALLVCSRKNIEKLKSVLDKFSQDPKYKKYL